MSTNEEDVRRLSLARGMKAKSDTPQIFEVSQGGKKAPT